jgi:hypothetical protein
VEVERRLEGVVGAQGEVEALYVRDPDGYLAELKLYDSLSPKRVSRYMLPSTSCTPTMMKGITETARTTFETSRLRYSGATRWEFRSGLSGLHVCTTVSGSAKLAIQKGGHAWITARLLKR